MPTDHDIPKLIINKVPTKAQYDQMVKNADELYLIPDDSQGLPDQTGQSGKYLKTDGTDASWESVPAGTVTSVRVQAGTGLASSQSTAQSTTLNTTISIASGYKLPTTTEWGNKQDVISDLSTIRDGASAGATAVQPGDLATVATSGAYSDLSGTPSLSTVAISGSYNDLSNKPTIPTVNDAVLTIQKNGTTVSTFTANSATNAVANITVPTKVSDLNNDSGFITGITANNVTTALGYTPYDSTNPNGYITSADIPTIKNLNTNNTTGQTASSSESLTGTGTVNLHKVSKTGSYNDLLNKPTIPTVNNATVTIQKNSTNVGSFTLNQSGNATVNITVPTKLSEFTDDLGSSPTHTHSQYLTSHQSIKTLNTTNTTAQSIFASEAITGTGTLNLHKVSKTGTFNDLISKPTSISGYGITDAYTKTEVDGLISSVYKPAGSVAYASLPTLASGVLGNVYNVTDAFTTDTRFVEGSGKSYPAGTNVVVVEPTSGTYKFDVLAGFVDLSGYVPTTRKVNNKALSADITLSASDVGALPDSTTIPQGTVKSVQVQAGTGLTSSTSTAQNTTLSTTISIASGYKLPTTTEWGNKQDALAIQTAYTSKGSATKVPQITTNTLGQVTGITEVDITQPTVNNSTITIQKNGTNVDSFTTNAASNKNINITLAKGDVGLGNVDNTADLDKPISTATQTALDAKQNTISDLGYIRNQVVKVDDKISAIDVTDSGSSLPAASGYNLNDTFVNKTDKKLYKVEAPAYALNSSVYKSDAITVDLTTGLATGFSTTSNPGGTWTTYMSNSYNTNIATAPIYVHFKTGSTLPGYNQYIFLNYTPVTYYSSYFGVAGSNTLSLVCTRYITSNGQVESVFNYPLFDTVLETNTEYYLYLEYNNGEYIATLSSTGYNINILETSSIEESTTPGCTTFYYGGPNNRYPTFNGMSVYLLDSTGNFLIADGALTWDSGTTLEDNTQYNDTTNEKTIYYNNNILYDSGDSLPSQSGQSGKFLTTDGTSTLWATVSIPTVNNSTITIQKNNTTVSTFTLNQSTSTTVNISVPTKTSDLTNDSGYLTAHQSIKTLNTTNTATLTTSASEDIKGSGTLNLHKVSKTGSYNDLLNKPTIPTVNNATLTIQKNSATISTFSANASANVTCNISVPTKVSELTNDSGYTTNTGTVTSVRVQAGTGLSSSTSTAQNTTLNTTISIASGYKLPTTTEWNSKQDALPAQSGNNGKFLTTNGSTMSWATVDALPSQSGQSGKYLTTNGTSASWGTISIPTVNNGVLTILQNGTTVTTFSANASSASNADIATTVVKFRDWSAS